MPWDPGQKWENKPSTATPLSADRLNSREKSITDYVDEQIDNHTHIIDQVDGLANALANKADVGHTHATLPSEGEKVALAGTSGTPGLANRYVTAQDPLRPPLADGTIQTTHVLTPAEANATLIHRGEDARTVIAPDHLSPAGTLPEGAVVRIARDRTAGPVVIDKAQNATLIGPAGTTGPYIVAAGGVVRLHRVQGGSGESLYVVEGDLTVAPRLPDPTSADEGDVLTIGSGGPEWAEPQGGGDFNPPWTEIDLDPQLFLPYFPGYMYPAWRWIEPLGVVEVRGGLIAADNLTTNALIVQLPTQYAPPLSIDFVVTSITGTVNQITIDHSGALFFVNPQQQGEVWHLGAAIRWNVPAS